MATICKLIQEIPWTTLRLCHSCTQKLGYSTKPVYVDQYQDASQKQFFNEIHQVLVTRTPVLQDISYYHFNGLGKSIRPKLVMLAAKALNFDVGLPTGVLLREQLVVAMVAEMIHTASLIHDDVIDESILRRGRSSVFSIWGQSKAVYGGDYILSAATVTLARLRHNRVMKIMSEILENLVQGEYMQLGTKENDDERFNHYIEKSYKKTASLIANSCKSVAVLANTSESKIQAAYQYGRNVGIAFQLIDDMLDFVSNQDLMGKPTAADLKLGLATAPILFASHEHPRLNTLIMRRFANDGDLEEALGLVKQSSGVEQTKELARRYSQQAVKAISQLAESAEQQQLIKIAEDLLTRSS